MPDAVDLDRYFDRIGWAGPARPDASTLRAICERHPAAISFENLDPLLERPVSLAPAALQAKLVDRRRGGWCFEHNTLLAHVLARLGFRVTPLAARVLWNDPDHVGPRTHMLLGVELDDGIRVVDVGFGIVTPTAPLRLDPDLVQSTPLESFRLVRESSGFRLEVQSAGATWRPLYRFDLQPQERIDYEVASWFLQTHPSSVFRRMLMCARAGDGVRYTLRNDVLTTHVVGETARAVTLTTGEAMLGALRETFDLDLSDLPEAPLRRILTDLARATGA